MGLARKDKKTGGVFPNRGGILFRRYDTHILLCLSVWVITISSPLYGQNHPQGITIPHTLHTLINTYREHYTIPPVDIDSNLYEFIHSQVQHNVLDDTCTHYTNTEYSFQKRWENYRYYNKEYTHTYYSSEILQRIYIPLNQIDDTKQPNLSTYENNILLGQCNEQCISEYIIENFKNSYSHNTTLLTKEFTHIFPYTFYQSPYLYIGCIFIQKN